MNVTYNLYNITTVHKTEIQDLVQKNLSGKLDSYLKGLPSSVATSLIVKIEKNKKNKYIGGFLLSIDGKKYMYKTSSEGFRIVSDLVNHSFDRFKEQLSDKR